MCGLIQPPPLPQSTSRSPTLLGLTKKHPQKIFSILYLKYFHRKPHPIKVREKPVYLVVDFFFAFLDVVFFIIFVWKFWKFFSGHVLSHARAPARPKNSAVNAAADPAAPAVAPAAAGAAGADGEHIPNEVIIIHVYFWYIF